MDETERLSAYLDGALSPDDAKQLEADMLADPKLAERLAALKASDETLRAAFAGPMTDAVPDRFMALLDVPKSAEVVNFAAVRAKRDAAWTRTAWFDWRAGAALAASLIAVVVVGSQVRTPTAPDATQIAFNTALDQTPSGQRVTLANGTVISPRLSFAARDGRFCREYANGADLGVACRGTEGWQVEALAKGRATPGGDEGYATAGGDGGALDPAYARLGAGDPLDAKAESDLIAKGWTRNR
jgi:Putative zinc-finger